MAFVEGAKHDPSHWLAKDVKDVPAPARELLETYAGVPSGQVVAHAVALVSSVVYLSNFLSFCIHTLRSDGRLFFELCADCVQRDEAFTIYPWPCIGQMRFLRLTLSSYPSYPRILSRLKAADDPCSLLDVGCCFGQDVRKLVVDGVPSDRVVGLDLAPQFYNLGRRLFRDDVEVNGRPVLEFDFYARDITDDAADWAPLQNRFDVLNLTSFLHIWNWDTQVKVACRLVSFFRKRPGVFAVGSSLGSRVGGEFPNLEGDGTNFRQSPETFEKFWKEVGERTETRWDVQSDLKLIDASTSNAGQKWAEPNMGVLFFEVVLKQG